ncbi:alkylation response protein AidB-like acyl-CoA dehydrogenase [Catenulispora sp. GP43]
MVTTARVGRAYIDDLLVDIVGRCLQLHGAYGYMLEHRIAHDCLDSRISTIYGGTTEIMKEIVGRELGL